MILIMFRLSALGLVLYPKDDFGGLSYGLACLSLIETLAASGT